MKQITIDSNTKAVAVHAKSNHPLLNDWIILISHTERNRIGSNNFAIYRHISYDIKRNKFGFLGEDPIKFGMSSTYDFYEATKEEKDLLLNEIKKKGYKFIPILNKIKKI